MFDPRQARKDFSSSLCVQTGSGVHSASCTMGTGGSFPAAKARPGRDADHSSLLVPRSRISKSYNSSAPKCLRGVWWDSSSFRIQMVKGKYFRDRNLFQDTQCSPNEAKEDYGNPYLR
jgi:hypothetical protein